MANEDVQAEKIETTEADIAETRGWVQNADTGFPLIPSPACATEQGTPYLRAPGVALLSKPQVAVSNLADFLGGFNPDLEFLQYLDDPTPLPPAAQLCKLAGQTCYASFSSKRTLNADAARYFHNINAQGHGCYDIETEALTAQGWKKWPEVTLEDELATLNSEGVIEYHHPDRLIAYRYKGRMYRVAADSVDLLVTPDHKMYACPTTTRAGRKRTEYCLLTCTELGDTSHAYRKNGLWIARPSGCYGWHIAALLGFTIGDGTIEPEKNAVYFHLRRERKIAWLYALVTELNWRMTKNADKYRVILPDHLVPLFQSIYTSERAKQIPDGYLTEAGLEDLQGLMEGLMQSDGSVSRTGDFYDTTSSVLAGQIQQLCLHLGFAGNISQAVSYRERKQSFGNKPVYRVNIIRRELRPEVNKFVGCKGRTSWIENWEGDVFCAEVPNNTLYVRRNGKPVWSGNSVLEHANFSFLFYGISRSVTHELVRHRAGVGVSQVSQRYVSGKVLRFVERPEYQHDPELHAAFESRIDTAASEYDTIAKILMKRQKDGVELLSGEARTDLRKKVQQAARSVLPNETEAPIVVTANVRAWRHILAMRASSHAEIEIRALAFRTYLCLVAAEPLLFGDYRIVKLSDGTYGVETDYPKV